MGDVADIPDYVAVGLGVALVPDFLVRQHDGIHMLELTDTELAWSIAAIRLAHRRSDTIDAIWRTLLSHTPR